jgi:thiol-disulfide isomerase/thioredoxin
MKHHNLYVGGIQMKTDRTHLRDIPAQITTNLGSKSSSKLIGIAAVALFALAACTASDQPNTDTSEQNSSAITTSEATSSAGTSLSPSSAVDLPLDFQIAVYQGQDVLGGQEVDFSGIVGQGKPVILNFWASFCPPCRLEMPDLQEVHEEFGDQVVLVGVDVGTFTGLGNEKAGRALLQEAGITYPAGTTANADVMRAYQVIGMPTTLFITPDGEIVERWTGLLTRDKMQELVLELIDASQS